MLSPAPTRAVIAVDGPAGAGKSTVAQRLAERLGGVRLDTGAIYRTLALVAFERGIPWEDGPALGRLADGLDLRFRPDPGGQRVRLGERDITQEIRTPEVSRGASQVSQHAEVRAALMSLQRTLAAEGLVVVEGRDIGTAVFPEAPVKFFLTASAEIRARRRWQELRDRGTDLPFDEVLADQHHRDTEDMQRAESPLRQARDAVVVDTTGLDVDQVVDHMARAVYRALDTGPEMINSSAENLEQELLRLEADLADRQAALPAHSIRPHQLIEIEDLEERIADLRRRRQFKV